MKKENIKANQNVGAKQKPAPMDKKEASKQPKRQQK
jgi:hypothetical protein